MLEVILDRHGHIENSKESKISECSHSEFELGEGRTTITITTAEQIQRWHCGSDIDDQDQSRLIDQLECVTDDLTRYVLHE